MYDQNCGLDKILPRYCLYLRSELKSCQYLGKTLYVDPCRFDTRVGIMFRFQEVLALSCSPFFYALGSLLIRNKLKVERAIRNCTYILLAVGLIIQLCELFLR